jgi:hypothetical protein
MKSQLQKRTESFIWRFSMAVLVFSLEWVAANAGILDLSPAVTGVIALMAGEVSKYLNSQSYTVEQ